VFVWSIVLFFITFLIFTVSAFAFSKPCNWAHLLGISAPTCTSEELYVSTTLAAPTPTEPNCSMALKIPEESSFLTFRWNQVPDASTYSVEVDCFGCTDFGRTWHSHSAGAPWHIRTGLGFRSPIYSSKVHVLKNENNGTALRWRVWAVGDDGVRGEKSAWCKLSFFG